MVPSENLLYGNKSPIEHKGRIASESIIAVKIKNSPTANITMGPSLQ